MSRDSLTMRHKKRWVSLHHNKFEPDSTPGTDSSYVVFFMNTAQPNLQSIWLRFGFVSQKEKFRFGAGIPKMAWDL